jgi:hypothetical protein
MENVWHHKVLEDTVQRGEHERVCDGLLVDERSHVILQMVSRETYAAKSVSASG